MRILLSGPPSSGKSTQGRILAERLGVPHVSSGGLIRALAASGDRRGTALLKAVANGALAPSGEIAQLVQRRLIQPDCADGFVLDGFPRRLIEASFICEIQPITAMLVLQTDSRTLFSRVLQRSAEGRPDDDPAHFPHRIDVYEAEAGLVQNEIRHHGVPVLAIDASHDAAMTAANIEQELAVFDASRIHRHAARR